MTEQTLAWMEPHLAPGSRVLEVGCGAGQLAAALVVRGHPVVAVDPSAEAVAAARGRGVDARVLAFPGSAEERAALEGPFDVVLFARSLHHIAPLGPALDAVGELLAPTGLLVVEDWAWDEVDRRTAEWMFGWMAFGQRLGLVPEDPWQGGDDPLAAWLAEHRDHHEDLQPAQAMLAAVGERFRLGEPERAPYAYRYYCRYLDGRPDGRAVCEAALHWERRLIDAGAIVPLGLRFTATPFEQPR